MAPAKKRPFCSNSINTTLRGQLQGAVQSIKWTYAASWQRSPTQKDVLVWGDGYYNGSIKTRKTVQAAELTQEELGMQRTRQLRELYETLSTAGDANQANNRRPSAALTPEDLTETEWFYLLCMSCSFSSDTGLPGKALSKGQHEWLTECDNASPDVFTRSLLAKTANVKVGLDTLKERICVCITRDFLSETTNCQTVVCIPFGEMVVEVGTKELIPEDPAIIQRIKSFFVEQFKPVVSEQSSSGSQHPDVIDPYGGPESWLAGQLTGLEGGHSGDVSMLLDGQKELDPKSWEVMRDHPMSGLELDMLGASTSQTDAMLLGLSQQRLQSVHRFGNHQGQESQMSPGSAFVNWRSIPAPVVKEGAGSNPQWMLKNALFHITHLYNADEMSAWNREVDANSSLNSRNRKPIGGQEDLNVSHVLAERRRREKLNDRFMSLRALVPFVTKMDKASILGDAIEYVKQLQKRVQEMEVRMTQLELRSSNSLEDNHDSLNLPDLTSKTSPSETFNSSRNDINGSQLTDIERRDYCDFDGVSAPVVPSCDSEIRSQAEGKSSSSLASQREEVDLCNSDEDEADASQVKRLGLTPDVTVNLVENEALLVLHCPWRRTVLVDVLQTLGNLQLDVVGVQASTTDGNLTTSVKATMNDAIHQPQLTKVKIQSALQVIVTSRS